MKGHLDQEQKSLKSMKDMEPQETKEDIESQQEEYNKFTGDIMCSAINVNELTSKSY